MTDYPSDAEGSPIAAQIDPAILRKCWFLAGPTACGKTDAACELAGILGAEVISLDSMSLYRGMDVGTAKPDAATRARVPHHLIDILDPHQEFSLADYVEAAAMAARAIVERGKIPLFVGGTGQYLRGVLRGVFAGPPANWKLRRELELVASREGPGAVHARLQRVDPVLAERLAPGDLRRVIRGVEVFEATGVPLSAQQRQGPLPAEERPRHVYWLHPPRAWLHERINRRVGQMFRDGLVSEVKRLLALENPLSRTALQALGYKEVIEGLARGTSEAEMTALIQARTRQFAKRQHTWFRNLSECTPMEIAGSESPREIAHSVAGAGSGA